MKVEAGPAVGPITVGGVLDRAVRLVPDRPALVDRTRRYTYAELDRAANRAARAMRELGVGPGVRVAASLPNRTEIVVAFLGAMRLGAVWLGIPTALAPPEKAYLLADSGGQVLLVDPERADQLAPHRAVLPALRETVLVDPDRNGGAAGWSGQLAAADPAPIETHVDPYAAAAIAYTSGTTGFPKGVVHSQYNLTLPGAVLVGSGQAPADWRYGVCLPLTQLNLMVCMVLLAFRATGTAVVIDRRDPEGVAAAVRDERVSTLSVPSTILQGLVDHPAVAPEDLATLVHPIAGGTSCPAAIKDRFRRRFGHPVHVRYGLTEAPTTVAAEPPEAAEPAAAPDYVGRVLPHLSVTIVDETGTPQPPGGTGEICLGPATGGRWAGAYRPMLGYLNQPEATAERLAGGLLHTGDVGRLDQAGNLYISGRRHDLILRGGANVYPAEVERVLATHPAVANCAVLGRPDPRLGERVVAFVQPADGQPADPEALQAYCGSQLARYKVPAELRFVPELPRNALGKIDKSALQKLLAAPRADLGEVQPDMPDSRPNYS